MNARFVHRQRRRQRGSYAAIFGLLALPILAAIGIVADLSMVYARRSEMQIVANAAALAAARALDGTMAGLALAGTRARDAAQDNVYRFNLGIVWNAGALRFASTPDAADGAWLPAGSVNSANVATMRYARVDTKNLDDGQSETEARFAGLLGTAATIPQNAHAVAGRSAIQVTPLGICAIRSEQFASRPNALGAGNEELLEYGFRRGVTYNLLNFNPAGSAPASYAINPIDYPGAANRSSHLTDASLKPFVCDGTLARPSLPAGAQVYVRAPFPPALTSELNSRFDTYPPSGGCNKTVAPPDATIRNFSEMYAGWWMTSTPAPGRGSVQDALVGGALLTIGESPVVVAGTNTSSYGTLWSYAKAVRYSASAADGVGAPFVAADFNKLYPVATGTITSNFPNGTVRPYFQVTVHRLSPSNTPIGNRRVLNLPLLSCPVSGDTATVLGIGRFLMTAPASASPAAVHGEFGGLVTDANLGAAASLYQ